MTKSFLPKKACVKTSKNVLYVPQRKRFCGAYVLRTIFSIYGLDKKGKPEQYWPRINRFFWGFSLPRRLHKELRKRGFTTRAHHSNKTLPVDSSLALLKEEIANNRPVIMLVGNLFSRKHIYSSKRKRLRPHWVLLLGYDDEKKVFYFYDSAIQRSAYQKVPVGNIAVSYGITYDAWRGELLTAIFNFYFITLHPPE